jgi:hypothetical protein
MYEGVNIIAVLGTTFFMMASATIWFSPLLFGTQWLRELKVTEAEIEASRQNLVVHLGLTALLYALALYTLAWVLVRFEIERPELPLVALGSILLVVGLSGTTTLWESRSKWYFIINAGFYVFFLITGLYILSYWPW